MVLAARVALLAAVSSFDKKSAWCSKPLGFWFQRGTVESYAQHAGRDVLYVNMFAMGMSLLNENFWWVLGVIPIYGMLTDIGRETDQQTNKTDRQTERQRGKRTDRRSSLLLHGSQRGCP